MITDGKSLLKGTIFNFAWKNIACIPYSVCSVHIMNSIKMIFLRFACIFKGTLSGTVEI